MTDFYCDTTNGQPDDADPNIQLKSSYYEIIDIVLAELKERFNSESLDIYAAANAIMGDQNFSGGAYAERIGLVVLPLEASHFRQVTCTKLKLKEATLMDYLDICDKGVFTKVHEFLTCLIICPVTSVSVERLFSTMKRVHTASRKSMSIKRLSHLCMLSFERDITQSLKDNPIRVIDMLKATKK